MLCTSLERLFYINVYAAFPLLLEKILHHPFQSENNTSIHRIPHCTFMQHSFKIVNTNNPDQWFLLYSLMNHLCSLVSMKSILHKTSAVLKNCLKSRGKKHLPSDDGSFSSMMM